MKQVLTIAGSDSGSGAGIQADLKTFFCHGVYGVNVITALTAQNTLGIKDILPVEPSFVRAQLEAVDEDFILYGVKIGMIPSIQVGFAIREWLASRHPKNVVIDPVMVATCNRNLIETEEIVQAFGPIFRHAKLITPNLSEAGFLSGMKIHAPEDMEEAAERISQQFQCSVLIKGGHLSLTASDYLLTNTTKKWFHQERIENHNNHGTGCTLSSSIVANLALGYDVCDAVQKAKDYMTSLLKDRFDLGHGNGPLCHKMIEKDF